MVVGPFTDDDLKLLKEKESMMGNHVPIYKPDLDALLVRLEAAERIVLWLDGTPVDELRDGYEEMVSIWRKAAGK